MIVPTSSLRARAAWLVAALALSACAGDPPATAPSPSPDASVSTATPEASASPTPTPLPPVDLEVTTEGAFLASAEGAVPIVVTPDCQNGDGATISDCIVWEASGGTALIRTAQVADGSWSVLVGVETEEDDTWQPHLTASAIDPGTFIGVAAETLLLGDDHLALVSYFHLGSGGVIDIDVVHWPRDGEPALVAHLPGRGKDEFQVEGGALILHNANFSDGSPNCCPTLFDQRALARNTAGEWTLTLVEAQSIEDR